MNVFVLDNNPIRIETFEKAFFGDAHKLDIARTVGAGTMRLQFDKLKEYDLMLIENDLGSMASGEAFTVLLPGLIPIVDHVPFVIVHTREQDAAQRMVRILATKNYRTTWHVFGRPLVDLLERMATNNSTRIVY